MTPEQETLEWGGVTFLTLGDITNLGGGRDTRPPKGRPALAEVSEKHDPLLTLFYPLLLINIVKKKQHDKSSL